MRVRLALATLALSCFLLTGSNAANKSNPTDSAPSATDLEANPLLKAVVQGDVKGVQALLAVGVDVNRRDSEGMTPLHWVRSSDVAAILIAAGARVGERDAKWGATPLHYVAWTRPTDDQLIRTLIGQGADKDARDDSGGTPLHWAAWHCGAVNAITLLSSGADRTKRDSEQRDAAEVWEIHCMGKDSPFKVQ